MTVHHLNTNLQGGAAIAALRVHASTLLAGCRSTFWHLGQERREGEVEPFPGRPAASLAERLWARWRRAAFQRRWQPATEYDFYDLPRPGAPLPAVPPPELLHLHWMQGWLSYGPPPAHLPPVVVTLHDMNAFTGGCIYDWGCERFATGCGQCPQLRRRGAEDASRICVTRKTSFWTGLRLHVVAPSRWMLSQARRSVAMRSALSFEHIPYGLDLTAFQPVPKGVARQALGLSGDRVTLLYGAAGGAADPRKGFHLLRAALEGLGGACVVRLLTFGSAPPEGTLPAGVELIHLGTLGSPRVQSLVYSAADLTVVPSLQDNAPQVVLESMACATPVLGTEVGGIPEMIVSGETGMLARPEPGAVMAALRGLLERRDELELWGRRGRAYVEAHHGLDRQGQAYRRLYERVLSEGALGG